jgi:uncharacterized protein
MGGSPVFHDVRLPLGHTRDDLIEAIARKTNRAAGSIRESDFRLVRQSIDSRHHQAIYWQYTVEVDPQPLRLAGLAAMLPGQSDAPIARPTPESEDIRPLVIGTGPAGLFAGLLLALAGRRPILLEQGKPVEQRQIDVSQFWQTGQLNPYSNVQFGEGGAGTFSDGKLTTGIKDSRCRLVLEELVLAGAPDSILFLAKPHVGTDRLRLVIPGLRRKIMQWGGEIWFDCRLAGIETQAGGHAVRAAIIERRNNNRVSTVEWPARKIILAIGHSSRQTLSWLAALPLVMEAKPFSLGVRVEHLQAQIDKCQYGRFAGHPQLPPAEYKMVCHLAAGRSVYSFCMCPGGQVIAAASEEGSVVTNGMSFWARGQENANSALLVGVNPADFPEPGPLGGVRWQQELERLAFRLGGGTYRAPAERLGSFLGSPFGHAGSTDGGTRAAVQPTYRPGVAWCHLADCLPPAVYASLREAIPVFDRKMPGFAAAESILTGLETRSSSPVRILRDASLQASLAGLYPCGEGAGYAGGIMSSAVDGLRCAEATLIEG